MTGRDFPGEAIRRQKTRWGSCEQLVASDALPSGIAYPSERKRSARCHRACGSVLEVSVQWSDKVGKGAGYMARGGRRGVGCESMGGRWERSTRDLQSDACAPLQEGLGRREPPASRATQVWPLSPARGTASGHALHRSCQRTCSLMYAFPLGATGQTGLQGTTGELPLHTSPVSGQAWSGPACHEGRLTSALSFRG